MDLTLSLTHNCNLGCTYCYAGPKSRRAMTRDVVDRAVEFAFSFGTDTVQLGFFGGEPLLEWDLLRYATDVTERRADHDDVTLQKTLTTNATLFNPERLAWLDEHDFFVALSVDGNRAMHEATRPMRDGSSSFDLVMDNLEMARRALRDYEVIVVPDPSNVRHLADSVAFLADDRGVGRISINPNFYIDWPDHTLAAFAEQFHIVGDYYIERFRHHRPLYVNFIDGKIITRLKDGFEHCDRCNFGEKEVAVAPSGNLYPCERLVGTDENEEMVIGNVVDGFDPDTRHRLLARRGNVNPDCLDCALKARCMNWCGCINYATTGHINRVHGVVCFHEQHAIEVADHVGSTLYNEANPSFLARFYHEDFEE